MRISASENWLLEIGRTNDLSNVIHKLNGLTVADAQSAFDKNYGKDLFEVRHHGTVITVWNHIAAKKYYQERLDQGKIVPEYSYNKYFKKD